MPIPILESCRKRKRRPKVYNFYSFGDEGCPLTVNGAFRDNIRIFLQQCAQLEDYQVQGMPIWCTLLIIEKNNIVVPLYTIEETVELSQQPFCNHCRCSGWSSNFVSKRKYHFIIPIDGEWRERLEDDVFDIQSHLLHGLIHSNGFGHLLCINGIEGHSKYLCGREIMDLWDRICSNLHARKITVEDVAKKRCMDLRLLYGVAYGHSWFGRWGYKFFRGGFGVKQHHYTRAVECLSSLELDSIIQDFIDTSESKGLNQMVCYYRELSEAKLITFRDILRFMLNVKSCPCEKKMPLAATASKVSIRAATQKRNRRKENGTRHKSFSSLAVSMDSRWPKRRLEYAAQVIVETLRQNKKDRQGHDGMARQDVRDAARMHIGDTGLLDYVLKSLNNVSIDGYVIRRSVNPKTRILEYSIDEIGDGTRSIKFTEPKQEPETLTDPLSLALLPGTDTYSDVAYLYSNVLFNYPESPLVELARQAILDCKIFVKVWPFRDEEDQLLRFICKVRPSDLVALENRLHLRKELHPGELVILPLHASVIELKQAAENAFRDTYCVLENFEVTEIEDMEYLQDRDLLFGLTESGAELNVGGNGIDARTELSYEGGSDGWKVKCECGAEDDDGERMVACDICEVWQHTRCNGIDDSETVPPLFVCSRCCYSFVSSETRMDFQSPDDLMMISEN